MSDNGIRIVFAFFVAGALFFVFCLAGQLAFGDGGRGPRCDSCEELRRIRVLLENQFQVVCNESRCLPAPTPTVPNGGELP